MGALTCEAVIREIAELELRQDERELLVLRHLLIGLAHMALDAELRIRVARET